MEIRPVRSQVRHRDFTGNDQPTPINTAQGDADSDPLMTAIIALAERSFVASMPAPTEIRFFVLAS